MQGAAPGVARRSVGGLLDSRADVGFRWGVGADRGALIVCSRRATCPVRIPCSCPAVQPRDAANPGQGGVAKIVYKQGICEISRSCRLVPPIISSAVAAVAAE